MAYRYFKRFPRKRRSYRKKKMGTKRVPKATKSYVKKEIHKQIENKFYTQDLVGYVSGDNNGILTPSASTYPLFFSLTPLITSGTGLMNKIGSRIRIKSSKLRIRMFLSGAAVTAAVDVPMNIYYIVLNAKDTPATLSTADLNQLFYYNSGGSLATTQFLSGSLFAATHKLNTDYFNIIKTNYPNKPVKLGWSLYNTTGLSNNNDYKSYVCFDVNIPTGKGLSKTPHFSNNASTPLDYNAFIVFYIQKQNNDTTTVNWDPPNIVATQHIRFEDA